MRVRVGTSGFSYAEWRGSFYPKDLKSNQMLRYYAGELSTVEINNTFYRMPKPELLAGWREQVPEDFRFVLKAPRRITHHEKLADSADAVLHLYQIAATLGPRLGPILFQLPPFFQRDVPRLEDFLGSLPTGLRAAFEFRHVSWLDDAVTSTLARHGAALCLADTGEAETPTSLPSTADFGYLRLRSEAYTPEDLRAWAERIRRSNWQEAYVFFKHELYGPSLAKALAECLGETARAGARSGEGGSG